MDIMYRTHKLPPIYTILFNPAGWPVLCSNNCFIVLVSSCWVIV